VVIAASKLCECRSFTAAAPNQLWVADVTFVPTAAGFLYLAVVLDVRRTSPFDAWSRKIVGWSMANHLRAELVVDALEMAIGQRRPHNVIHHSDQGSQYRGGRPGHVKLHGKKREHGQNSYDFVAKAAVLF